MKGYQVATSDGQKIGRVKDVLDGFLVVELGRFLRSRRPVPKEFAHAADGRREVVVTVPKKVLRDAPKVRRRGSFDLELAARHYGLASSFAQHEPIWAEPTPEHRPERIVMPGGK